jgi:hypothetical protein
MIPFYGRFDKVDIEFLKTLSDPVIYHIRTAIKEYIQKFKNQSGTSSASKTEGGNNNG